MTEVRRPPLPEIFKRYHPLGECRWCGEAIYKTGNPCEFAARRNWHDGRSGERDCVHEYKLLTDPATQRHAVFKRDAGRCYLCGKVHSAKAIPQNTRWQPYGDVAPHTSIDWLVETAWELEHKTPLWSVDHLPDDERIRFFQLGNLGIACSKPCHADKTAREAARRAKEKRIADSNGLTTRRPNRRERVIARLKQREALP